MTTPKLSEIRKQAKSIIRGDMQVMPDTLAINTLRLCDRTEKLAKERRDLRAALHDSTIAPLFERLEREQAEIARLQRELDRRRGMLLDKPGLIAEYGVTAHVADAIMRTLDKVHHPAGVQKTFVRRRDVDRLLDAATVPAEITDTGVAA